MKMYQIQGSNTFSDSEIQNSLEENLQPSWRLEGFKVMQDVPHVDNLAISWQELCESERFDFHLTILPHATIYHLHFSETMFLFTDNQHIRKNKEKLIENNFPLDYCKEVSSPNGIGVICSDLFKLTEITTEKIIEKVNQGRGFFEWRWNANETEEASMEEEFIVSKSLAEALDKTRLKHLK